tara:strand:- start:122 stop:2008 length:1887 start_codon:yes stop_codon:yes gene_type:complete
LTKIILITSILDLNLIPNNLFKSNDTKIFSFNLDVHLELKKQKINHTIADDLLSLDERLKIFDKMAEFRSWYSKISSSDFELKGINLLKILDRNEFQTYLLPILINLVIVKEIIKKEKPTKIIATTQISKIIQSIIKNDNIKTEFFKNEIEKNLLWNNITAKYNFGGIPLTFTLSRQKYLKIKNIYENLSGLFYNFWFKFDQSKKKSIVFLEFNPQLFSKLFEEMANYDGDVILINHRRSAIWSKKSIEVIKKSKCKILKLDNVLNKHEQAQIPSLVDNYSRKIDNLWKNSEILSNIFQISGYEFWDSMKDTMMKLYSERLFSYISLILSMKKITDQLNIKCIVSLNESGETEKTLLGVNKKKFPTVLLEHGFIERISETKRFDILSEHTSFNDKIVVWGEPKKRWLINEYDINPNRIFVTGSPRHDDYFSSRLKSKNISQKTLLLAPNPINDINGQSSTSLKLQFIETIKKTLEVIKKFDSIKIIVKLHPIQLQHNEEIELLIKKFDTSIPIYLWAPVIDIINTADMVMVLTPEIHATPTMLLESMILGKPTMNVYFDKTIPEYDHIKNNAVFTVTNNDDLENKIKKFLFDDDFQNLLQKNADNFVNQFMSNPGTASKNLASILKSY